MCKTSHRETKQKIPQAKKLFIFIGQIIYTIHIYKLYIYKLFIFYGITDRNSSHCKK